jgi:hypothetical protein
MTDSETPIRRQLEVGPASAGNPRSDHPIRRGLVAALRRTAGGLPDPPRGVTPNNYLAWSIVSIFLLWPLAIAVINNATKVDPTWQMGNTAMAQEHSH